MTGNVVPIRAPSEPVLFPPGLVGDVANFVLGQAPYPNRTIALSGAIGFLAGICGNAFNVSDTGLNLYGLTLAPTGTGKDAVQSGIGRLITALHKPVPAIHQYSGPGELVSAAGLFKWLARAPNSSVFCILGEFGLMLKTMTGPKASAHMIGLKRAALDLYSKSGRGSIINPTAYSDPDKVTAPIFAPALTLIAESTPETFYSVLDQGMIESGLLSRFLIFETYEPRPFQNRDRRTEPCPQLLAALATLAQEALELSAASNVRDVPKDMDAAAEFVRFEIAITNRINVGNEVTRQLWNRADLKAQKLAALVAVGRNPRNPWVTLEDAGWAMNLVEAQTVHLIGKFESGETGDKAGNELEQMKELRRVIGEYLDAPPERVKGYPGASELHGMGIFTGAYLSNRLLKLDCYAKDPAKPTPALKRAIQNLIEADEIEAVPSEWLWKTFGIKPKSYRLSQQNPRALIHMGQRPVVSFFED